MKPRNQGAGRRSKKTSAKRSIYRSLPRIVYVIELDPDVASVPAFALENPRRVANSKCYYVGSSTLTAEQRFKNHLTGHLASPIAQKFGRILRKDLMPPQTPIRKEWALNKERRLARELRAQGCAVWQK